MNRHRIYCWVTALVCAATCLGYEAMRINGWFNRHGAHSSSSFYDVAIGQWPPVVMVVYALILAPWLVVYFSRDRPVLRGLWLALAIVMLVITWANVPSAYVGRWSGTHDSFALFYILAMPVPALVCFVIGLVAQTKAEQPRRIGDVPEPEPAAKRRA